MTRLPVDTPGTNSPELPAFQYSSREIGPPHLLIQQLRRAHSIFLLLHDFSLDDLYKRAGRSSLCLFLDRFWVKFAWNWDLLLTGSPIVDIYNGIKLAAGGELGVGVGEEEWGSGEREVLEDFVTRTDGLLDLVVSRFGDPSNDAESKSKVERAWLGSDTDPRPADGVIFSGTNALSRASLVHVSHWMEWIYRYGDAAYGVGRDPCSLRRRKPRKSRVRQPSGRVDSTSRQDNTQLSNLDSNSMPGIPRPLVTATRQPVPDTVPEAEGPAERSTESSQYGRDQKFGTPTGGAETIMRYLTLGYGSSWSLPIGSTFSPPPGEPRDQTSTAMIDQKSEMAPFPQQTEAHSIANLSQAGRTSSGHYILGPRDDLDTLDDLEESSPVPESNLSNYKTRIVHRTIHVHLADAVGNLESPKKLQTIIYIVWPPSYSHHDTQLTDPSQQHQPFMFTFLFEPDTPSLSSSSFYSSIYHQLGPLQKPLLSSTSPKTAASRIALSESSIDSNKRFPPNQPVYDLVYDPSNLTIRSSIPNIPSLNAPSTYHSSRTPSPSSSQMPTQLPLSRVESLAIHHRLLVTYIESRTRPQELERTCKTNRGWWIVWLRIPQANTSSLHLRHSPGASSPTACYSATDATSSPTCTFSGLKPPPPREAFLVRKASDYVPPAAHGRVSSGARFFRDLGGASSSKVGAARGAETTPSNLVEGLGLDARRYIEGLLRLNQ